MGVPFSIFYRYLNRINIISQSFVIYVNKSSGYTKITIIIFQFATKIVYISFIFFTNFIYVTW